MSDIGERYRDDGYVVVRQALTADELDPLRAEARRVLEANAADLGLPPAPGAELERRVLCLHHVHKLSPRIGELAHHPEIVGRLAQLVGDRVKLVQTQLFFKGPGLPGNGWHQDESAIPSRDRSLVAAWLALDRATTETGCLRVVPGSHASGYLYPEREHGRPDRWDFPTVSDGFDEAAAVEVEMAPGDLIFFNGYLVHGSEPNRGGALRRALTFHYMNAYSLLPWKVAAREPGEVVRPASVDYRDVVMVLGEDPYAWKGYADESRPHLRKWGPGRDG